MDITKDSIQTLLDTDDRAVVRALLVVYSNQTNLEKVTQSTREHNGVGFSSYDAPFLTSLAQQATLGRTLTAKQVAAARPRIRRYWRQLLEAAKAKQALTVTA